MDVLAVKGRQFLLAQMPHAVMVRYFFNATFFRLALTAEGWYSLAAASKKTLNLRQLQKSGLVWVQGFVGHVEAHRL